VEKHNGFALRVSGLLPGEELAVTNIQHSGVVRFDFGVEVAHTASLGVPDILCGRRAVATTRGPLDTATRP
jgi:hypothetical protein